MVDIFSGSPPGAPPLSWESPLRAGSPAFCFGVLQVSQRCTFSVDRRRLRNPEDTCKCACPAGMSSMRRREGGLFLHRNLPAGFLP